MRTMLLIALLASPAFADDNDKTPDVKKMVQGDCARARAQGKTCVLTIEDEKIEGGRPSAGETSIVVNPFGKHGSLISIRRDFIPEILKSAEDID